MFEGQSNTEPKIMSRREFLRKSAVVAVGIAAAGSPIALDALKKLQENPNLNTTKAAELPPKQNAILKETEKNPTQAAEPTTKPVLETPQAATAAPEKSKTPEQENTVNPEYYPYLGGGGAYGNIEIGGHRLIFRSSPPRVDRMGARMQFPPELEEKYPWEVWINLLKDFKNPAGGERFFTGRDGEEIVLTTDSKDNSAPIVALCRENILWRDNYQGKPENPALSLPGGLIPPSGFVLIERQNNSFSPPRELFTERETRLIAQAEKEHWFPNWQEAAVLGKDTIITNCKMIPAIRNKSSGDFEQIEKVLGKDQENLFAAARKNKDGEWTFENIKPGLKNAWVVAINQEGFTGFAVAGSNEKNEFVYRWHDNNFRLLKEEKVAPGLQIEGTSYWISSDNYKIEIVEEVREGTLLILSGKDNKIFLKTSFLREKPTHLTFRKGVQDNYSWELSPSYTGLSMDGQRNVIVQPVVVGNQDSTKKDWYATIVPKSNETPFGWKLIVEDTFRARYSGQP